MASHVSITISDTVDSPILYWKWNDEKDSPTKTQIPKNEKHFIQFIRFVNNYIGPWGSIKYLSIFLSLVVWRLCWPVDSGPIGIVHSSGEATAEEVWPICVSSCNAKWSKMKTAHTHTTRIYHTLDVSRRCNKVQQGGKQQVRCQQTCCQKS